MKLDRYCKCYGLNSDCLINELTKWQPSLLNISRSNDPISIRQRQLCSLDPTDDTNQKCRRDLSQKHVLQLQYGSKMVQR
jgi:hypothetical protein